MALPFNESGLEIAPLYDEQFFVALPKNHPMAQQASISNHRLQKEPLLVLGAGHCFRDHVLEATPAARVYQVEEDGLQRNFEGSSLETLRYMAAAGIGITVLPALAVPEHEPNGSLSYVPLVADKGAGRGKKSGSEVPHRRVVLVWRKHFSRQRACEALAQAVRDCGLLGVDVLQS